MKQCMNFVKGMALGIVAGMAMAVTLKMNTVFKSAADRMSKKDLEGKIVVGEFANSQRDEFTEGIEKISVEKSGKKTLINSAYSTEL